MQAGTFGSGFFSYPRSLQVVFVLKVVLVLN